MRPHPLPGGAPRGGAHACALALWLRPDHAPAHRVWGEALLELGRHDEALRAFDRYLRHGPPVADVFKGRALAQAARGDYAAVTGEYTRALAAAPKDPALHAARGWAYLVDDAAPKLALPDFTQAIRL